LYIVGVLTLTPWEFTRGIHANVEVDQCDQRGHGGLGYLVLVWDFGKGFKAMGAKHNSHLTYSTHVGIVFPSIWTYWAQHGGREVITLGFSKETLKPFLTSSIQ
jgi:hypothetical protein